MKLVSESEGGSAEKFSSKGVQTLLVDDDADLVDITREMLELAGCDITTALYPSEAMSLIEAGREFDLLFTDYRFPGLVTGIELANEAVSRLPGLKVIIATGFDSETIESESRPGYVHMPKPFSIAGLKAAVAELFAT